jgi:cytoplasmic iron level regulating protein YaaA (DUF328/UPF0246 family)
VLILLPPSEGKTAPRRGNRLALDRLSFPGLTDARDDVLQALVRVSSEHPEAERVLGLTPGQSGEIVRNAGLLTARTARADKVYSGVLYDALDVATLDPAARRRATRWLAVQSSLFGLLRPGDPIPAYRLSGDVSLPGLGGVAAHWRNHLDPVVREATGNGLLVDLRSSTYATFWRPAPDLAVKVATVRVLHEVGGRRQVVSHFNKATKGRLLRALLEDGTAPRSPAALADHLGALGWKVETGEPTSRGTRLDVVVSEV